MCPSRLAPLGSSPKSADDDPCRPVRAANPASAERIPTESTVSVYILIRLVPNQAVARLGALIRKYRIFGAPGGTRTPTPLRATDFESLRLGCCGSIPSSMAHPRS